VRRWEGGAGDSKPGERDRAFNGGWFGARYTQAEEDAKLLNPAGEVAEELQE